MFTILQEASKARNEKILCAEASLQRCSHKKCFENMQQIYRRAPTPKYEVWSHLDMDVLL